jgi:hypothetical protein
LFFTPVKYILEGILSMSDISQPKQLDQNTDHQGLALSTHSESWMSPRTCISSEQPKSFWCSRSRDGPSAWDTRSLMIWPSLCVQDHL